MILRKVREYLGNGRTAHYYEQCYTPQDSEGKRGEKTNPIGFHCPSESPERGSTPSEHIRKLERELGAQKDE